MVGADVFTGVSGQGHGHQGDGRPWPTNPIIFAMANPDPEITPEEVGGPLRRHHGDRPLATTRTRSTTSSASPSSSAAPRRARHRHQRGDEARRRQGPRQPGARGRARLGDQGLRGKPLKFGRDYLIPKPFDYRVLLHVAPAVAQAARLRRGAACRWSDRDAYVRRARAPHLAPHGADAGPSTAPSSTRNGSSSRRARTTRSSARPRSSSTRGSPHPILLARPEVIADKLAELGLPAEKVTVVHHESSSARQRTRSACTSCAGATGSPRWSAGRLMRDRNWFGDMMVPKATPTA
jgi:malate dehydrogenase (oxaloacetate-decarboxylating)(NADP+)